MEADVIRRHNQQMPWAPRANAKIASIDSNPENPKILKSDKISLEISPEI